MKGQKRGRRLVRAVLVVGLLAAVGCEPEAARFNNTLAAYNRRLNVAGKRFIVEIAPALQGEPVNQDRLWDSFEKLRGAVQEIKQEFAALPVPPGESARRLAEGYAKFLRGQDQMVLNDINRMVRMLQRAGTTRSANPEIVRIFREMQRREQSDLVELRGLQQEFAREHRLPLLPAR